jgi:hypothetical protein
VVGAELVLLYQQRCYLYQLGPLLKVLGQTRLQASEGTARTQVLSESALPTLRIVVVITKPARLLTLRLASKCSPGLDEDGNLQFMVQLCSEPEWQGWQARAKGEGLTS